MAIAMAKQTATIVEHADHLYMFPLTAMESPWPSKHLRRGAWSQQEDALLIRYIEKHGSKDWTRIPQLAGLNRCRKSCRLRWLNYLDPNIKRGDFEEDEIDLIIRLHKLLGNRWSLIAGRLPGRTANHIKNYWNSRLRKKAEKDAVDHSPVATVVIKPQARTVTSVNWSWLREQKADTPDEWQKGENWMEGRPYDEEDKTKEAPSADFSIGDVEVVREGELITEGTTEWDKFMFDVHLWD